MKKWYAVVHGDCQDWGYGSTRKREAIKMANAMKRDPYYAGEFIAIVVVDESSEDKVAVDEIIIREGTRA